MRPKKIIFLKFLLSKQFAKLHLTLPRNKLKIGYCNLWLVKSYTVERSQGMTVVINQGLKLMLYNLLTYLCSKIRIVINICGWG